MNLIETISWLKTKIQADLFSHVEGCTRDPLTEKQKRLITTLEIMRIEEHVKSPEYQWMGRKLKDRYAIARAFVAKAVYDFNTTSGLMEALKAMPNLRRICGFNGSVIVEEREGKTEGGTILRLKRRRTILPSEATFSRAFAEFAGSGLGDRVHEALVREHMSEQIIGHISRDATAIIGNEKPVKKEKKETKPAARKGRPRKGEERAKEEKRIDRQFKQTADEALKELPMVCDVGCKTNSQGYKETWIGYKLHIDTNDCGLPITAVLTAASLHDSQVALPLMKMTTARVPYLYDLMDSAYDSEKIHEVSKALGHVPIIDRNPRRGDALPMGPAEAVRYNERSVAERTNSRLKGEFGGESVMVRGYKKVKLHLMFGIVALFVDQMLKLTT
jgi:rubrerythrin